MIKFTYIIRRNLNCTAKSIDDRYDVKSLRHFYDFLILGYILQNDVIGAVII